jgi:hypothetical protein
VTPDSRVVVEHSAETDFDALPVGLENAAAARVKVEVKQAAHRVRPSRTRMRRAAIAENRFTAIHRFIAAGRCAKSSVVALFAALPARSRLTT